MYSLKEIAELVDASIVGDESLTIRGLASLTQAQAGDLTHLSHSRYRSQLTATKASAVLVHPRDVDRSPITALVVTDPYLAYAQVSQLFRKVQPPAGIHELACIHPSVELGESLSIGPYVTVGADTVVNDHVSIGSGCQIGQHCVIGSNTILHSNICLYDGVQVGARCEIHANTVIGSDGFGFIPTSTGKLQSIAQLGGVRIGNEVVIGASCTVDRGALDDTIIEDGVKLDDQVHIGHNCIIGAHSMLCGCTGLGGSVEIGERCILAGGVGVAGTGPLTIVSDTKIGAMTYVSQSIDTPGTYQGATLHTSIQDWRRNAVHLKQLKDLVTRVGKLEKASRSQHDNADRTHD